MAKAYKIGEAAKLLNLKTYVLRFWETEFPQITPLRTDKGQRLYSQENIEILKRVQYLLHDRGLTIEGARRILDEERKKGMNYGNTDKFVVPFTPEIAPQPSQAQTLQAQDPQVQAVNCQPETEHLVKTPDTEKKVSVQKHPLVESHLGVPYREIIEELEDIAAFLRTKPITGNIKQ